MTDISKDIINLFLEVIGSLIAVGAIFYAKIGMKERLFIETIKNLGGI